MTSIYWLLGSNIYGSGSLSQNDFQNRVALVAGWVAQLSKNSMIMGEGCAFLSGVCIGHIIIISSFRVRLIFLLPFHYAKQKLTFNHLATQYD